MKRVFLILGLVLVLGAPSFGTTYTATISETGSPPVENGLYCHDGWGGGKTTSITSTVDVLTATTWEYTYTFATTSNKEIASFYLEVSGGSNPFTAANIIGAVTGATVEDLTDADVARITYNDSHHPAGIEPGDVFFKFVPVTPSTNWSFSFVSDRDPYWGGRFRRGWRHVA